MPCNGVAVARVKLAEKVSDKNVADALAGLAFGNVSVMSPGVVCYDLGSVLVVGGELVSDSLGIATLAEVANVAKRLAKVEMRKRAIATVKKLGEVVEETAVRVGLKTGTQLTIRL